jgi:DNA-binding response OmpR family regulator
MEQLSSSHFQPKSEPWVLREKQMTKKLLLIGSHPDSMWVAALRQALQPLTQLDVALAREAGERLQQKVYDLIVLDYSAMGNALETLSEFRQREPATPIIVVSASPTWQQAKEVLSAGAADYMPKSLDVEELGAAFKEILSRLT